MSRLPRVELRFLACRKGASPDCIIVVVVVVCCGCCFRLYFQVRVCPHQMSVM